MIARPTSSPLPQEIYFTAYEDPITGYSNSYIPYTSNSYEPAFHSDKRLKIEPQLQLTEHYLQALDNASNFPYGTMHQNQLRTPLSSLSAPHINLHRPSEPASPVTVATTLSQHSTPSPSPSRVSILSDSSNPDWILFEDPLAQERAQSKEQPSPPRRHHYNQLSNNNQHSQYNPMIVPQLDSSYANSGLYPGYPHDQNFQMTDYKLPQQHYLKPYPQTYQELSMLQQQQHQTMDDEPPALSPPSHQTRFTGRPSVSEDLHHPIPKLHRTVSDAVEDELFHDSGIEESQRSQKQADLAALNPRLAHFYQEAQNQHITAAKSLTGQLPAGRETSPFRANSPFHPGRLPTSPHPIRHSNLVSGLFNTARAQREQQKELETEAILNQQLQEELESQAMTPKTISPKDAMLEYPEPEDEASKMSLFPDAQTTNGNGTSTAPSSYHGSDLGDEEDFSSMATSRRGSEANSIPNVEAYNFHQTSQFMGIPSTYQYLAHTYPGRIHQAASEGASPANSHGSEGGQQTKPASPVSKPASTKADTGAYTCTEHGCNQRFPTSQKMTKHRREAHRQSTPLGSGMTSAASRHPGPHKCTRINPTTNKPCNTIFSRPYDLTRHEDTIHNTSREKVRCEICNDEKTFSRQDALTRHKKVKHGIDK